MAVAIVLLCAVPVMAQDIADVRNEAHKNFFSLSIENDSIGGGTDRDYTSGVRVSYYNVNADIPDFIDRIAETIPTFDINHSTSLTYSLGQNLYTPGEIKMREQNPDDRPWAAWLYGSAGLTTLTGNHIDELELTLGMVGSVAMGEPSQKFIHSIINSPDPKGWDHQLDNEPGVIISWQRRWPELAQFEALGFYGSAEPNFNISLGNIYTYAGTGLTLKISPVTGGWQDNPPRVRPSMPGTGYFQIPENDWGWYLFAGVEGRAVARNIFLDGNSFSDSHSIDKNYFVGDANTGIAFTYKRTRLSYSIAYRTEEFHGQENGAVFGAVSLSYRY